jgi:hypothetical protein
MSCKGFEVSGVRYRVKEGWAKGKIKFSDKKFMNRSGAAQKRTARKQG